MTNCMSLDAKIEFDTRRLNALETLAAQMSKAVTLAMSVDQQTLIEELVGTAVELDELWKQELKNSNGRSEILSMCVKSTMDSNDKLEQQKALLEKVVKEMEANVVSSSSSYDPVEDKHNINVHAATEKLKSSRVYKDTRGNGTPTLVKSDDFSPRINEKNLKEVFKYSNYYSKDQMGQLVSQQVLKWHKRGVPQLLAYQSNNDSRLKKAAKNLDEMVKKVPKWLVVKNAISRLIASKEAAEAQIQQAALDRATLQARQDQERRDQRRALENAKRVREDLRDAMHQFRTKKPNLAPIAPTTRVHVNLEPIDEYDMNDGFAVKDHESEPDSASSSESEDESSSDDELGALSDAVNDLDVGNAAVESLDE